MVLLHTSIKNNHTWTFITKIRWFSQSTNDNSIKKSVYISQSNDIYTNLALEDWIYRKMNLANHHILMLWQNEPCVVIGRHQNPWLEANIPDLPNITDRGVKLARRDSGGGTVYHDLGNLNLTFFTPKERYSRKYNLEIMTRAIYKEFGICVDISPRQDLTFQGYKVSGTAAKLGRPNAYHHCTLLVDVNEEDLSRALRKRAVDIKTNATQSIKSRIVNLSEEQPEITVAKLMNAIGWEYMKTPALTSTNDGMKHTNEQEEFKMVDATDVWFPGIGEIRNRYRSWEWCYGKTPKFSISKCFAVPHHFVPRVRVSGDLKVSVMVEEGKISDVAVTFADGSTDKVNDVAYLVGQKFSEEALSCLNSSCNFSHDTDNFVVECVKEVITSL